MLRIAICDDERWQVEILVGYIKALTNTYPNLTYDVYFSGHDLQAHYRAVSMEDYYDVIFLDIDMGNSNGLAVAKEIRKID